MSTVKYILSIDHFEIEEIEVFVYISPSNFNNLHTPSGHMAVSHSWSCDPDDMRTKAMNR